MKVTIIGKEHIPLGSCVFIANHQSNYDIFFLTAAVPFGTVSIGKKSILFFPFFGLVYWLLGNIFIERTNKMQAIQVLQKTKEKMLKDNISVWLFPEGTRNYSKGLRPFKTGAFYLARHGGFPVVPVAVSNYYSYFRLNRLVNGEVIIKFLPAITIIKITSQPIREVIALVYKILDNKIAELDEMLRESNGKILKSEKNNS
ncbi:lysophospholipid acyltransferase family protein [Candidatus Gillettellia adelgis]